jgi:hypothetical protein
VAMLYELETVKYDNEIVSIDGGIEELLCKLSRSSGEEIGIAENN